MLSNVSWSEFGAVLGVLLVLYYLFVGAKYYHKDIKDVLAGKAFKKKESTPKNFPERFMNDTPPADNSIDELETIVNDLRYAVLEGWQERHQAGIIKRPAKPSRKLRRHPQATFQGGDQQLHH